MNASDAHGPLPSPACSEPNPPTTARTKPGLARAYFLAARPKTLTAALIPVLVATALAHADGRFDGTATVLCALFACAMQVAANYVNDLYDHLRGTDRTDRLGPRRACAQGWVSTRGMKRATVLTIAVASAIGLALLAHVHERMPWGGWELVGIGVACVVLAVVYTTYLSYRGWGDALVLIGFGFIPVAGTYYVQTATLTADVWVAALVCGLCIDTLLTLNNYRDREQDRLSGKLTLVVRLGGERGRWLYAALGVAAVAVCGWWLYTGRLTPMEMLWAPGIYLYLHAVTCIRLWQAQTAAQYNKVLGQTSRNMLLLALLLAAALI